MTTYNPDKWAIIKIVAKDSGETLYKVMGSWYGGFGGSNSWKLNSGIDNIEKINGCFHYHGYSGSVYVCHESAYGMSMYTHSVYESYRTQCEEAGIGSFEALTREEALALEL